MVGEGRDTRIVQRGIDEAFACQDMLARAPVKPSWLTLAVIRVVAAARSMTGRKPKPTRQATSTAPYGTS